MSLKFSGFAWKEDRRKFAVAKVRRAGMRGLEDAAEFLLEEANRTIPHETGEMQRSGAVSSDAERMQAAVSYNTPYAPRQHEDTRLRHDPGRRAKWLQLTCVEQTDRVADHLRRAISKAVGE